MEPRKPIWDEELKCFKIPLTRGKFALVDSEDVEMVGAYNWCCKENGYAVRSIKLGEKRRQIYMHTALTGYKITDHINQNKLDNRRANLRECTQTQNQGNRGAYKGRMFKGVFKRKGGFFSRIAIDKKEYYIGWFSTELEAAKAYNEHALKHFGEFACLNPV